MLSESDMSDLMTEVALIDGYLNTLPIDSGKRVMPVLYQNAFRKFNIDSTKFIANLNYYFGNPKANENLYSSVSASLENMERGYNTKDSIRNVVVQDSMRKANRITQNTAILKEMIMNFHKSPSSYTYMENGVDFLSKAELQLGAYGIQSPRESAIPVQAQPQPLPTPEAKPIIVDTAKVAQPQEIRVEEKPVSLLPKKLQVKKEIQKSVN